MSQTAGVVALLFTDLVGSTEVLDRLGDDVAEELRRSHFSLLRRAVAEAGGTEVKSLGDGLMVAFASPVKALECAIDMQRTMAEHSERHPGQALQIRVGVHAGEPVREADDYHGSAVVVAKRLCDQARGGQILVSELVAGLVGRRGTFSFRPAGRLSLKGLAEPVAAVTLEWAEPATPRAADVSPAAVAAPSRPLVGRRDELARVEEALAAAAEGHGRVLFLVGEMGIGKTRLAEEVLLRARERGFLVLVGRTPPPDSGLAYAPVLSAFGSVLRAIDPWRRDRLIGDLPHLGHLWPELGLPPPAPVHDPELERTLLFEAVARLLQRLTTEAPVALFVDDLHWADGASLALLGYLVHGLGELPILLVGAYRPEGPAESRGLRQLLTAVARSGIDSEARLGGLDHAEVAALVAGILGDIPPPSLLDLSERTGGTPLFVDALIRGLIDAKTLVRSEGGWTLVGDQSSTLPRGVRDLIVDRLDLLGSDERAVVELIGHAAQGLPHALLESATGLDAEHLVSVVDHLVAAGLVLQEVDGPDITYRLSHPLVQEVAASDVPAIRGRRLHARLARATEARRAGDLDRLAYHYSRAVGEVDEERAVDILLEAGERAHRLFAHDQAARHFEAVLPLLRRGRRPELLAHVLECLGESWEPLGETAAAMEVWAEAVEESQRSGDALGMARLRRRLGMAARSLGEVESARRHLAAGIDALADHPPCEELADLYHALLLVDSPLFDPDGAAGPVAELSRLADALGSPRCKIESLSGEGSLHLARGEYAQARAKAEEALAIAEQADDWSLLQRAHRDLVWVAWSLADIEAALRHAGAQLELDRRFRAPAQEPLSLAQLAAFHFFAGDLNRVVEQAETAAAQARKLGQRRILVLAVGVMALAQALRGDLEEAAEGLAEIRGAARSLSGDRVLYFILLPEATLALERGDLAGVLAAAAPLRLPAGRVLVGTAQALAGDLEGALATARELAGDGPPGSFSGALADRVFGLVEKARGDSKAARDHLECSATALAALGLSLDAAISRLYLGTAESLREALATFEAQGATRYADRARRALRDLGVRVPAARSGRPVDQPLSRRELEVARLVAEGLTNAEIAQRLVLSVRTVDSHLEHIYSRLGISSRASLARWVTEQSGFGSGVDKVR